MDDLVASPPCEPHGVASVGICVGCERYCCPQCYRPDGRLCTGCQAPAPQGDPTTRALGWITGQPGWFGTLLVAGLISLAGIAVLPAFAYMGQKLRVMRRAMVDPDAPLLLRWDDFFGLVGEGFRHLCALALPILVLVAGFVLIVGAAVLLGVGLSLPPAFAILGILAFYAFVGVLALLLNAVQPAITLEFLESGSVLAGFRVGKLWRHIADRFGDYLVLVLLQMVLNFIAGMVGLFTCYLGFLVSMPWAQFTYAYIVGRYVAEHYPEVARRAAYSEGRVWPES